MRNFFGLVSFLMLLFFLSGCGGGGSSGTVTSVDNTLKYSSDAKTITGFVKIGVDDIVDTNSLVRKIELSDFYIVAPGCEVASATFSPAILTFDSSSGSIQQLDIEVNFNSSCSDANIELHRTKTTYDTVQGNVQAPKSTTEFSLLPVSNSVISPALSYKMDISLDSSSIKIEDSVNLLIRIYKKENNATTIDDANVHNVTLTSEFPDMLKFNVNGTESTTTSYLDKAQNSLRIDSFTKAGIAIIKASATIFDGEKNVTIEQDFSYTIMSGSISSLSLVYVDTNYDNGLFFDHYIVHAVDKYGNPANKGEHIYAGVVNGLEFSSKDNVTPLNYDSGTIGKGDPATFSVNSTDSEFGNVVVQKDRVIVLASDDRHDSRYLGGWSVQSVDSDTRLTLDKKYDGASIGNLSFVIGSEDRADTCGNTLALADLDSQDNSYTIGENGTADLVLRYDPYLVGKDVYMYVNAYTIDGRVGTPLKKKLYGKGITSTDKTCTTVGNCSTTLSFTVNERGGEALKNVAVPIKYEGSCQPISGKTVKVAVLGCTGTIYTETNSTDADDPCSISWDGSIYYDSVAPTSTIYY
ncbi:hypothetical protein MNB_SV-13-2039 [hydrothermal vent metagenome]|uniref:Lipoprotein n=1 Tax=hydrothermal vent metagenome TaxID=652676 RepID=A0A1W1CZV4_9ZZZZ